MFHIQLSVIVYFSCGLVCDSEISKDTENNFIGIYLAAPLGTAETYSGKLYQKYILNSFREIKPMCISNCVCKYNLYVHVYMVCISLALIMFKGEKPIINIL